jgi:hypothetical protein
VAGLLKEADDLLKQRLEAREIGVGDINLLADENITPGVEVAEASGFG